MADAETVTAKVVAMVVLGGASLALGMMPLVISSWHRRRAGPDAKVTMTETSRSRLFISLLLAFGGGALLCTTFLHLLPEVREALEELQESGGLSETSFHLPELLMCSGFFAMYLIEEIVHVYLHYRRQKIEDGCGPEGAAADSALQRTLSKRRCSRADALAVDGDSEGTASGDTAASVLAVEPTLKSVSQLQTKLDTTVMVDGTPPHPEVGLSDSSLHLLNNPSRKTSHNGDLIPAVLIGFKSVTGDPEAPRLSVEKRVSMDSSSWSPGHRHDRHHSHVHHVPVNDDSVLSSLRGLLIVLALSVHELFEGLAVGLQETASLVYYLMGAVAAHKLVLAFCVGVQLVAAGTRPTLTAIYVATFALVSPIGVGVGLALGVESGNSVQTNAATSVLQGLACGTLLYVVFFEILQQEATGIRQFVATAAGFLLMFGLLFTVGDEHDHGTDHDHDHDHEVKSTVASLVTSAVSTVVSNMTASN